MADLAIGCFALHRLEANVQLENSKSISLVRGVGFRLEGFSPDHFKISSCWQYHQHWAVLVEDWKRRQ
jgi:ribosomal-protein-alanine N-acetyltransferase